MSGMTRNTLVIFTPSRGVVDIKWAWHFHHAYQSYVPPMVSHQWIVTDRTPILDAFNGVAEACIKEKVRYLAILEDDVFAPPGSIGRLIRRLQENPDHGIATGVYFMKRPGDGSYPLVFREWEAGADWTWKPGEVLLDVAGGSQGICVVDVEKVLAKMTEPRFRWDWAYKRDDGTEITWGRSADLYLFYACRKEAGMKILVDCGVLAEHHCRVRNKFFPDDPEMRARYGYPLIGPFANDGDEQRDNRHLDQEIQRMGFDGTCDVCGEETFKGACTRCDTPTEDR